MYSQLYIMEVAFFGRLFIMNNNISLGTFLKKFRENSNYLVEDVAMILNISVSEVEQFESTGIIENCLLRDIISSLYNMPMSFFDTDYSKPVLHNTRLKVTDTNKFQALPQIKQFEYLNKAKTLCKTIDDIAKIEAENNTIEPILQNANMNLLEELIIKDEDTFEIATHIYKDLQNLGMNNFSSLEDLLYVFPYVIFDDLGEEFSGFSFYDFEDGKTDKLIVINKADSYVKQLFTFFHEITHIYIHSSKMCKDITDENIVDSIVNKILLPKDYILQKYQKFSMNSIDKYISDFIETSKQYNVGYKTIAYALFHANIIKENQINAVYTHLIKENSMGKAVNKNSGLLYNKALEEVIIHAQNNNYITTERFQQDIAYAINYN